ncbi:4'-phosphopantetheinyl transferase family protein [Pararhizobium sp. LjRoot238]|uniref:4'-phosphopantetheinyl transferase family protein n=1 Tax=Pararhizobium sp. LjRoot238 TaxID=3342293 RepID=UPI003ED0DF8B
MVAYEAARRMEDFAAIGSELRRKWLQGDFHAAISISVPHQQFELWDLPLSTEESSRADRFTQVMDRNRSVTGWIALRGVVGAMLECRPDKVEVIRAPYGKPVILSGPGVSIAHVGDLALVGLSSAMAIGVDVESIEDSASFLPTIMGTLGQVELDYLYAQKVERAEFLLRAWTRKEATAKVFGSGLFVDFQRLAVADQEACGFRCCFPGTNIVVKGTDLKMSPGYIAALASTANISDVAEYHVGD